MWQQIGKHLACFMCAQEPVQKAEKPIINIIVSIAISINQERV